MFDSFTIYMGAGLLAGLVGFVVLFRKWDFPGWIKSRLKLYSRIKAVVYVMLQGVLLAMAFSLLAALLQLPNAVGEVFSGLAIGLNCAILAGLMQPADTGGGSAGKNAGTNIKGRAPASGGRRSKG